MFHPWPRFLGLAGAGAQAEFHGRQEPSWESVKNGPSGHTQPFDTWRHVCHYRSQPLWWQKGFLAGTPSCTKPKLVAAITLANEMARAIRAMMTKNEDYLNPEAVA